MHKKYIKNGKLILPEGFNSYLDCSSNNLISLILPEGFNSYLNAGNAIVYTHKEWLALERNRKIEELLN